MYLLLLFVLAYKESHSRHQQVQTFAESCGIKSDSRLKEGLLIIIIYFLNNYIISEAELFCDSVQFCYGIRPWLNKITLRKVMVLYNHSSDLRSVRCNK